LPLLLMVLLLLHEGILSHKLLQQAGWQEGQCTLQLGAFGVGQVRRVQGKTCHIGEVGGLEVTVLQVCLQQGMLLQQLPVVLR
jgi:hypothetical protein